MTQGSTVTSGATPLRTVPRTLDALLGAAARTVMAQNEDGKSSATFARVTVDGRPHVVKHISYDTDWVMRATHDTGLPRVARLWANGVFDDIADVIDTAVVACSFDPSTGDTEILMHDVGDHLLRDGTAISVGAHAGFVDGMAALHATTWGLEDRIGLTTSAQRWTILPPTLTVSEAARGFTTGVPSILAAMWHRLSETAPDAHAVLAALAADPTPLVRALATTPRCLVHGDWKGGNLGRHADGRTILLDWAFPGIDAPLADLAWYLGVNCDRLPESKEATIERYRAALEARGIDTAPWWDRQLPLALMGHAVQMAWSKADQPEELAWWTSAVARASAMLEG
ncbi:MAG TPA: phosphotransferase [Mycobacteriales bacterium]|nr:phosphotransferase [Mycobacteriales bacterium]